MWLKYHFSSEEAFDLEGLEHPPSDRSHDVMPSHCKPWLDGQTKGLLLRFPYRTTLHVSLDKNGEIKFDYDESAESSGLNIASNFSPGHFGVATGCILRTTANVNTYVSHYQIGMALPLAL